MLPNFASLSLQPHPREPTGGTYEPTRQDILDLVPKLNDPFKQRPYKFNDREGGDWFLVRRRFQNPDGGYTKILVDKGAYWLKINQDEEPAIPKGIDVIWYEDYMELSGGLPVPSVRKWVDLLPRLTWAQHPKPAERVKLVPNDKRGSGTEYPDGTGEYDETDDDGKSHRVRYTSDNRKVSEYVEHKGKSLLIREIEFNPDTTELRTWYDVSENNVGGKTKEVLQSRDGKVLEKKTYHEGGENLLKEHTVVSLTDDTSTVKTYDLEGRKTLQETGDGLIVEFGGDKGEEFKKALTVRQSGMRETFNGTTPGKERMTRTDFKSGEIWLYRGAAGEEAIRQVVMPMVNGKRDNYWYNGTKGEEYLVSSSTGGVDHFYKGEKGKECVYETKYSDSSYTVFLHNADGKVATSKDYTSGDVVAEYEHGDTVRRLKKRSTPELETEYTKDAQGREIVAQVENKRTKKLQINNTGDRRPALKKNWVSVEIDTETGDVVTKYDDGSMLTEYTDGSLKSDPPP